MNKPVVLLLMTVWLLLSVCEARARDLMSLIPGLYGGDGIRLATEPGLNHSAHFAIGSAASFTRLNKQLASETGVFPFSAGVGGFSYAFDPDQGAFVRTVEALGPVFAEQGRTIGRGRFSLQFASTFFSYDSFEGKSLKRLQAVAFHQPDVIGDPHERELFELDKILINMKVGLNVRLYSLAVTYGLTEALEVGLLMPVVNVTMRVNAKARVIESQDNPAFHNTHRFDDSIESARSRAHGSATGVGDVMFRAKYHWLNSELLDLAGTMLVKFATGDTRNFFGSGHTTVRPALVASRTYANVLQSGVNLSPHVNVGYLWNFNYSRFSAIEYATGVDLGLKQLALLADLLGSHRPFGNGIGDHRMTASLGSNGMPWKTIVLFANFQLPLNHDGLRSQLTQTFGVEYTF